MTIEDRIKEAYDAPANSSTRDEATGKVLAQLIVICDMQQELILQLQRDNIENLSRIKKLEQGNWTNG